jgi:hypothetical protein
VIVSLAPGVAQAGTLDQQQTDFLYYRVVTALPTPVSVAQTFIPGISGKLDQVDVFLTQYQSPNAPLTVEIRNAPGGVVGNTVLASASVGPGLGSVPVSLPIAFAAPASVAAGTIYSIVAYTTSSASIAMDVAQYEWWGRSANVYDRGQSFTSMGALPPTQASFVGNPGADMAFRTYILSPSTGGGPTGQRAASLKKCKKMKKAASRRKCKQKAIRLPV